MALDELGATELRAVIATYAQALGEHQASINALNVFPVPDGDTGTNMLATVVSVTEALASLEECAPIEDVCAAISKGSLMGARGNSGVILCQILRAIAEEMKPAVRADGLVLAQALSKASDAAYGAVMRPVEGTILTVARGASEAAQRGELLADVATKARDGAIEALWHTPEQLAVLAESGVVDSGGTGLELFFESLVSVVCATPMPHTLALPEPVAQLIAGARVAHVVASSPSDVTDSTTLAYEVMFLLDADDARIEDFKAAWAAIGDSIVVVGGSGMWNCHIHTNAIGPAIEAGIAVGRPHAIRVTDLREEVAAEESWVLEGRRANGEVLETRESGITGVVAVASGGGLERIFSSLGVARIVHGGQSMNPSTKELLDAIDAIGASEIVILPNNGNIIPVARQAAALSQKHVEVVETKGVQQGIAALLEFDPGSDASVNAATMREGAARVVAGEVTRAVRDAPSPVGTVAKGDWIGLSAKGIESVGSSMAEATCGLLEALIQKEHEIVTLLEGESCARPEVEEVLAYLADRHPHVSVERLLGGQPLYPLLVSIE